MNPPVLAFPGTGKEASDFLDAVVHNCTCRKGPFGMLLEGCELHHNMVADEMWLKRSVFYHRIAMQLEMEEWTFRLDLPNRSNAA